jgi:tRNA-dihydrouridine synthase B
VPKIAKHNAGCSLMREPEHAASVIGAMAKAVRIPVTVKMRAGWNDAARNAPDLARRVQDAGAAAVTIHGRTAEQSYSGFADWELVSDVASALDIPVLGSGDCIEPEQIVARLQHGAERPDRKISGVLVGRGVLRNPWILAQAADLAAGREPRVVSLAERGRFLLDYVDMLQHERVNEAAGFRHTAPAVPSREERVARGHDRWVINKLRALCSWYSKGLDGGSHLRVRINGAESIPQLREIIDEFFVAGASTVSV